MSWSRVKVHRVIALLAILALLSGGGGSVQTVLAMPRAQATPVPEIC